MDILKTPLRIDVFLKQQHCERSKTNVDSTKDQVIILKNSNKQLQGLKY